MNATHPEPPLPADHDAWARIVDSGGLGAYREEQIVSVIRACFRKKGIDQRFVGAMIIFISDRIMTLLRRRVSRKWYPNEGRDIIENAHGALLSALLSPNSADGEALGKWFRCTIRKRAIDHIRPVRTIQKNSSDVVDDLGDMPDPQTALFSVAEQEIHVQRLLGRIRDKKKKAAFELHMEGIPFGGQKGASIANILSISPETASLWVKDVQGQLAKIIGDL